ncbi:MAG: hypothetical protein ACFFAS_05550 [Promethearchaeota archaeon]
MGDNLKDMLDNIDSHEKESATLQQKIEKLMLVIEKQKTIISDLETLLDEQKSKSAELVEIPEDIRELKAIIGELRTIVNEKDTELEHAKADLVQVQTELNLSRNSMVPMQEKLKESYETIGKLQTEIAEKNSEVMFKNDKILSLENKINQIETTSKKFKEELNQRTQALGGEAEGIREQHKKEIEELHLAFSKERQEFKAQINDLESKMLDQKLGMTEKINEAQDALDKYSDLKQKYKEAVNKIAESREVRKAEIAKNEEFRKKMSMYEEFYKKNAQKIKQNEKLTALMEHEPQFKAFLILEKVGSMTIDELRNALGSPMVMTQRFVKKLEELDLVELNDTGKYQIKKVIE